MKSGNNSVVSTPVSSAMPARIDLARRGNQNSSISAKAPVASPSALPGRSHSSQATGFSTAWAAAVFISTAMPITSTSATPPSQRRRMVRSVNSPMPISAAAVWVSSTTTTAGSNAACCPGWKVAANRGMAGFTCASSHTANRASIRSPVAPLTTQRSRSAATQPVRRSEAVSNKPSSAPRNAPAALASMSSVLAKRVGNHICAVSIRNDRITAKAAVSPTRRRRDSWRGHTSTSAAPSGT